MLKLNNSLVTIIALAMLVSPNLAQAFFEPSYAISTTIFDTVSLKTRDLIKTPHKDIFIVPRGSLSDNIPIKSMMRLHGISGRLQRSKYKGKGIKINEDETITFTGRVYIKNSSFLEIIFAQSKEKNCLLEATLNNNIYIVYPRMINSVYNFKCQDLE